MAPRDPIRPNLNPTGFVGEAKGTNAVSEQAMWEQMCHLQSDTRKMLTQSMQLIEISKQMLSEQQQLRAMTQKLADETSNLGGNVKESVEKMTVFMEKVETVMQEVSKAVSTLDDAIAANDDNIDDLVDEIRKMSGDNELNVEMMYDSIESIQRSALILAYVISGDDESKVKAAEKKAQDKIDADRAKQQNKRKNFREQKKKEHEVKVQNEGSSRRKERKLRRRSHD